MIVLAGCIIFEMVLVYVVHPLRERSGVRMSSGTNGVVTHLSTRLHPLLEDGSKFCDLDVAVSEKACQIFIASCRRFVTSHSKRDRSWRKTRSAGRIAFT